MDIEPRCEAGHPLKVASIPVAYNSRLDASCMAPCLRWWGSIRSPSRPLLAAFGKTYRSALGDEPQIPGRLPQPFCYPPSTLMPPNGSCRQLHATARHFERLADEVSVSPLKFKFEPPCRSSSSSNVGAFAAFHCDTRPGLGCSFWRLVDDDCRSPFENGAHFRASLDFHGT